MSFQKLVPSVALCMSAKNSWWLISSQPMDKCRHFFPTPFTALPVTWKKDTNEAEYCSLIRLPLSYYSELQVPYCTGTARIICDINGDQKLLDTDFL